MDKFVNSDEQLFSLAREIGRMLKDTDEYKRFSKAALEFNSSSASVSLLERFSALDNENAARISAGDKIEEFILEETEMLRESVEGDDVIMNFLRSRKLYMDMLEGVQRELEKAIRHGED